MGEQFIWVMVSQVPNSGAVLEQGKTYNVKDYGADIVAEWVRSGAAKYVEPEVTAPASPRAPRFLEG